MLNHICITHNNDDNDDNDDNDNDDDDDDNGGGSRGTCFARRLRRLRSGVWHGCGDNGGMCVMGMCRQEQHSNEGATSPGICTGTPITPAAMQPINVAIKSTPGSNASSTRSPRTWIKWRPKEET